MGRRHVGAYLPSREVAEAGAVVTGLIPLLGRYKRALKLRRGSPFLLDSRSANTGYLEFQLRSSIMVQVSRHTA